MFGPVAPRKRQVEEVDAELRRARKRLQKERLHRDGLQPNSKRHLIGATGAFGWDLAQSRERMLKYSNTSKMFREVIKRSV